MYIYRVMNLLHTDAKCAVEDSTKCSGSMQVLPIRTGVLMAWNHDVDLCVCITEGR